MPWILQRIPAPQRRRAEQRRRAVRAQGTRFIHGTARNRKLPNKPVVVCGAVDKAPLPCALTARLRLSQSEALALNMDRRDYVHLDR